MLESRSSGRLSPYAPHEDIVPSTYPVSKPIGEKYTAYPDLPYETYPSHHYGAYPPHVDYQQVGPSNLPEMAGPSNPPHMDYQQAGPSTYKVTGQQEDSYYAGYDDYKTYDRYCDQNFDWNYSYGETPMQLGTPLQPSTSPKWKNEDQTDPDNNIHSGSSRASSSGRSSSSFGDNDDSDDDEDDAI